MIQADSPPYWSISIWLKQTKSGECTTLDDCIRVTKAQAPAKGEAASGSLWASHIVRARVCHPCAVHT